MFPKSTTYPSAATNATWQKKKSLADKASKATKQTGLGPLLKAAEESWNDIKWDDLKGSEKNPTSVSEAKQNLVDAKAAHAKVKEARTKLLAAKTKAKAVKGMKGLSKGAAAAAAKIETDLGTAIAGLGLITLQDFELAVARTERAQAAANGFSLKDIKVKNGGSLIMTGANATWDLRELDVTGVVWKKGTAADYRNKKLVVTGERVHRKGDSDSATGFANDMKLDRATGTTATFKSN